MPMPSFKPVLFAGVLSVMNSFPPTAAVAEDSGVSLTVVNPAGLYDPAPNGYSHAVVTKGGSRLAFVAGQGGEDASGALSPVFAQQVRQAYANLRRALDAVGARPGQVAGITTYVVDYDPAMLAVMTFHVKETFGRALPAQTLVPVPRLALDGMLFEVDAVAVLE